MSKKRDTIRLKYNGLCAYSGKPLDEKWQIDHIVPVKHWIWHQPSTIMKPNDITNLVPTLRILNHYKRAKDLEQWRDYLKTLHTRLAKLPKRTVVARTQKRKEYLLDVAAAFGITVDEPFNGVFYFETLTNSL